MGPDLVDLWADDDLALMHSAHGGALPELCSKAEFPGVRFLLDGRSQTAQEWATEKRIPIDVLRARFESGWSVREMLEIPDGGIRAKWRLTHYI